MSSRLILSGLRSIEECLRFNPDRVAKILVSSHRQSARVEKIREMAVSKGVKVEPNPKADPEEPVLAVLQDYQYADFDAMLEELKASITREERPVVLALDGLTDSHNLGAILRTAAFMGIEGVVLPKDRSAVITETVYRIASGGMEHLRVAQVTNLVSSLQALKSAGFWIVGFSEHAEQEIRSVKQDFPAVLVIGNEEKGIRPLVQENCDFLVKLANRGAIDSLNASVAASLAMAWSVGLLS